MDNDTYLNALSVMGEFMPNRQDPTREYLQREAHPIDVDLDEVERRIEQYYREQGVKDGQFKNHGSTTHRRTFD